jgi:Bacterial regulatory proteins, luxR family
VWFPDLALADRLADAAIRAGGAAEANFIRAHALSWLGRGQEADAVLAGARELTDVDRARRAFLRATNRLFVLADPAGAKRLIEDASQTTPVQARGFVDAFLTAQRCGARTPALGQASTRLPLTDREREIALLIGAGLSNREVAARLTISVRTSNATSTTRWPRPVRLAAKTSRRCCPGAGQSANRSPLGGALATEMAD